MTIGRTVVMIPCPNTSTRSVRLGMTQVVRSRLHTLPGMGGMGARYRGKATVFAIRFRVAMLLHSLRRRFSLLHHGIDSTDHHLPRKYCSPVVVSSVVSICNVFCTLANSKCSCPRVCGCTRCLHHRLLGMGKIGHVGLTNGHSRIVGVVLTGRRVTHGNVVPARVVSTLRSTKGAIGTNECPNNSRQVTMCISTTVRSRRSVHGLVVRAVSNGHIHVKSVTGIRQACTRPRHGNFFISKGPTVTVYMTVRDSTVIPSINGTISGRLTGTVGHVPANFRARGVFFRPSGISSTVSSFV